MALRFNVFNGHGDIGFEATYTGAVSSTSPVFPLFDGTDYQELADDEERRGSTGIGPIERVKKRRRSSGTIVSPFSYDQTGRFLHAILGNATKVAQTGFNDNYLSPAVEPPSFRLRKYQGDTLWTFQGIVASSLEIEISGGEPASLTLQATGNYPTLAAGLAATPSFGTYQPLSAEGLFTVSVGGQSWILKSETHTLRFSRSLAEDRYASGGRAKSVPFGGPFIAGGTIEGMWESEFYDVGGGTGSLAAWRAGTVAAITVDHANGLAGANARSMRILYPAAVLTEAMVLPPSGQGANRVRISWVGNDATIGANALGGTHSAIANAPVGIRYSANEDATGY